MMAASTTSQSNRMTLHRRLLPCLTASVALAAALGSVAHAQTFRDATLEALYMADKTSELHRVSAQRLAAQPDDAQAVLGLALAALQRNDPAARQDAMARAETCVARQPKAALPLRARRGAGLARHVRRHDQDGAQRRHRA